MIVIRFLPLDRVYYLVNDKVKEGYVMRVILPNRFTIFDIDNWIFDIDILSRDIIKLVKRQLPIGCEYHCKNCAVLKGLHFCGICPIRQKLILPNLGLRSNICGFGIYGLEIIQREMMRVELVFPKSNKHKDGTREGLLEVLDNQLEYNLWDYIIYKWSSLATGNVWLSYRELIEKLINTDSVPEELYKTSIPSEDFCGYCIFKGSRKCSNCYFSSLVLDKNKNYYE